MKTRQLYNFGRTGFWCISIIVVLIIGVHYFPLEDNELDFWGALYYSIRLFILEHDIPHFPQYKPLVFIYFYAPLVSLSIVGTLLSYIYQLTPAFLSKWKKNHVVICGVGRTGKLIASTLGSLRVTVVGIDSGPPKTFEKFREDYQVPVIHGDFLLQETLRRAGSHRAGDIVFASSNDLLNIDGAIGAYDWLSKETTLLSRTTLWVHVANEALTETVRTSLNVNGKIRIRFFDTFRIAATRMVDRFFYPEIRKGISSITLLGFGKFGRDLLEVLVRDQQPYESWKIDVIDILDRGKEVKSLSSELGVLDKVNFIQADILDVDFKENSSSAVFLCTDDDIRNLTTALTLSKSKKKGNIYVRMAMWPLAAVKDHLGENHGIIFVNINDLVSEGIRDIENLSRISTGASTQK